MSTFVSETGMPSTPHPKYRFRFGYATDIGGSTENQDDYLVWTNTSSPNFDATKQEVLVACILDGHGREVGSLAANTGRKVIYDMLEHYERELIASPQPFLVKLFKLCHIVIKYEFIGELLKKNYDILLTREGYLIKRKNTTSACQFIDESLWDDFDEDLLAYSDYLSQFPYLQRHLQARLSNQERIDNNSLEAGDSSTLSPYAASNFQGWTCVQGGTSLSILAIVGDKLWVANVGDSTGILCVRNKIFGKAPGALHRTKEMDASTEVEIDILSSNDSKHLDKGDGGDSELSSVHLLTSDHSPENFYEFLRMREYRRSLTDPNQPAINLIYDTPRIAKVSCPLVFPSDTLPPYEYVQRGNKKVLQTPRCFPSQKGSYYKNTRREWTSLVSTPASARFLDALAFTRSLGDLHLHTYGVTNLPEITSMLLSDIFTKAAEKNCEPEKPKTTFVIRKEKSLSSSPICLVLCSDGVWDNWVYEDVRRFVLDSSCINALKQADLNEEKKSPVTRQPYDNAPFEEGSQKVTQSFIQRNKIFSRNNFGANADNATCIIVYIEPVAAEN